jgi:hypothetical protein
MPNSRKKPNKKNVGRKAGDREVSYASKIRAIGNSRGVIYIMEAKANDVNTDLATWDKQFKAAIKKGAKPEEDLFEGLSNEFDKKGW